MDTTYRAAAWVPAETPLDYEGMETPAVEWITTVARDLGIRPILVVGARDQLQRGAAAEFGQTYGVTTPRTADDPGHGLAVLICYPWVKSFDYAQRLAAGGALCVVEGIQLQLADWAADVGAINLMV